MRNGLKVRVIIFGIAVGISTLSSLGAHADVRYVDRTATATTPDGMSWSTAYQAIQPAIDALQNTGGEVWVAAGVYDENRTEMSAGVNSGALQLRAAVQLYGGFSGRETVREKRNPKYNVCVIQGAKARDGLAAYHVVLGANDATLDGFTITGGQAADTLPWGGGLSAQNVSPTIVNCIFENNTAVTDGGGVHLNNAPGSVIRNCVFEQNMAAMGGNGGGGGLYMTGCGNGVIVDGCTFKGNWATAGGAVQCFASSPVITNGVFLNNHGGDTYNFNGGGAIYNYNASSPLIQNCSFYGNQSDRGSSVHNRANCSPTLTNCIVYDAITPVIFNLDDTAQPLLTRCCTRGFYYGTGNIQADPQYADPDNGNLRLQYTSPCIDTGTTTGAPSTDIAGTARPAMAGIDMGAYEMPKVFYVDKNASPLTKSGETWASAFTTIQDGVNAANAAGGGEVWVSAGVYDETRNSPTKSLVLYPGVTLRGGFSGAETTDALRGVNTSGIPSTQISGNYSQGHYASHVLIGADACTIDGCLIDNGRADTDSATPRGGGALLDSVSPTFVRCEFLTCQGVDGGAVYLNGAASPVFNACTFNMNLVTGDNGRGGAVFAEGTGYPVFDHCTFLSNIALGANGGAGLGGGMLLGGSTAALLSGCQFVNNNAARGGGVAVLSSMSIPQRILNTLFHNNTATTGAGFFLGDAKAVLANCTLVGNTATTNGGGLGQIASVGMARVIDSILWSNTPDQYFGDTPFPIAYSDVQGIVTSQGNINQPPLFVNESIGDMRLTSSSPCVNAGTLTGAPAIDAAGVLRPQSAAVDMGMYEAVPNVMTSITVDTLDDVEDGDTASVLALVGSSGADGKISLREAMDAAYNTPGQELIHFQSGLSGSILLASQLPANASDTDGIYMDGDGRITLNGTNLSGSQPCLLLVSPKNTVRGFTIIKSPDAGIYISGSTATNNQIGGCILGTDINNTPGLGNKVGITISDGAHDNFIGGSSATDRNVISGNISAGILIQGMPPSKTTAGNTSTNFVSGNYIGTTVDGSAPGPCNTSASAESDGIVLCCYTAENLIGGVLPGNGNIISGNCGTGIYLYDNTANNTIFGNIIGLTPTLSSAAPNTLNGISLRSGATGNHIGGMLSGEANTIAGNTNNGVFLEDANTSANYIQGNLIGAALFGNGKNGVILMDGASDNIVGGAEVGFGNAIVDNGANGVLVSAATAIHNQVRLNNFQFNTLKPIALDGGANQYLQPPLIDTIFPFHGSSGIANSAIDIYVNGEYWHTIVSDANGLFDSSLALGPFAGQILNATVTDAQNNTSEFSATFTIPSEGEGEGEGATEGEGEGEGEGEIEGAFEGEITGHVVTVELSNVDDAAYIYLNNVLLIQTQWGWDETDTYTGHHAGYTGERVVPCDRLLQGLNRVDFFVWNAAGCCTASATVDVRVDGEVAAHFAFAITDSTEGYKFARTYALNWAGTCTGEGEGEGEQCGTLQACIASCGGNTGTDNDHDGLSACVEQCLCTSDDKVDTDDDGMPDLWEATYGLDPTRNDADADPDFDGLTNLEEYLLGSNPVSRNSPRMTFFVAPPPLGDNETGDGTATKPWATISYPLAYAGTPLVSPQVLLFSGDYEEDVVLPPGVRLAAVTGETPRIVGAVTGAANAELQNVEIAPSANAATLLAMNDVAMKLKNVVFTGVAARTQTGIVAMGSEPAGAVIESCRFTQLAIGVDVTGSLPKIRRCVFENLAQSAVLLRISQIPLVNSLGDETDPTVGCNTFAASIDGPAVDNQRGETLSAQLNDWATDDAAQVAQRVSGPATTEPFLATGAGLLAGSLYCTVIDGTTHAALTNATVTLSPGLYAPQTDNVNGVYAFPALPNGLYTVTSTATGLQAGTTIATVGSGQMVSVTVPMLGQTTPPTNCNCNNSAKKLPEPGELFLGALTVLAMFITAPLFRRKE